MCVVGTAEYICVTYGRGGQELKKRDAGLMPAVMLNGAFVVLA